MAQVVIGPGDSNIMVVRLVNGGDGLLYSRDAGRSFRYICGSSVKDATLQEPALLKLGPMGIGGDGKMLMGVFGGLWHDDGTGCSWTREAVTEGQWVTDVVAHPSDPNVSFFISSNGGESKNGITRRNADGTFTELGFKKQMLISRLRVVELPGGGLRFYESGVLRQVPVIDENGQRSTSPSYVIRVSNDQGATWTEHELGVLDGTMRLEAVDPTNPDRLIINVARDRNTATNEPLPDQLLVSRDQGATFTEWTTVNKLGGIVFTPDGEVWIGDGGDSRTPDAQTGLKRALSLDEQPSLVTNAFPVNCLEYAGEDALFVCQRFSFGRFSMTDLVYTPSVELTKVEALQECPGVDTPMICRQQLCGAYCLNHFTSAPMCIDNYGATSEGCAPLPIASAGGAGGASGASGTGIVLGGAGGDTAPPPVTSKSSHSGCGCGTLGSQRSGSSYAALGLLAAALRFARRRRRTLLAS